MYTLEAKILLVRLNVKYATKKSFFRFIIEKKKIAKKI